MLYTLCFKLMQCYLLNYISIELIEKRNVKKKGKRNVRKTQYRNSAICYESYFALNENLFQFN